MFVLSQPFAEGFFIYTECDNVFHGGSSGLYSPSLSSRATQICVQFRYYMYGSETDNVLRVLAKRSGGEEDEIWKKTGYQSPSWLKGEVTLTKPSTDNAIVSFFFSPFLNKWKNVVRQLESKAQWLSAPKEKRKRACTCVFIMIVDHLKKFFAMKEVFLVLSMEAFQTFFGQTVLLFIYWLTFYLKIKYIFNIFFLWLQILFEAQRGSSHSSSCDIALDNIVISEGHCPCEFTTQTPTYNHTDKCIEADLCHFVYLFVCPQLVFQAVILTRWMTYVGGQLKLKILPVLALSSGVGRRKLKAVDLRMISPNLDVNCFFSFFPYYNKSVVLVREITNHKSSKTGSSIFASSVLSYRNQAHFFTNS